MSCSMPAMRAASRGMIDSQRAGADDVGQDVAWKQLAILQDDAHLRANLLNVETGDVLAVEVNGAGEGFSKPQHERNSVDFPEPGAWKRRPRILRRGWRRKRRAGRAEFPGE